MQDVPGARFDLRVFSEEDARNTVFVEWLYLIMTVAVHLGGLYLYNVVYLTVSYASQCYGFKHPSLNMFGSLFHVS